MPESAPILSGLNSATLYLGVSLAPLVGRVAIAWNGAYWLGPTGAVLILLALATAESAHTAISSTRVRRVAPQAQPLAIDDRDSLSRIRLSTNPSVRIGRSSGSTSGTGTLDQQQPHWNMCATKPPSMEPCARQNRR